MTPLRLTLLVLASVSASCAEETASTGRVPGVANGTEDRLDAEALDDLRALGYADDVGERLGRGRAAVGVTLHEPERAAAGLTLVSHARLCRTELIDMDGRVVHAWEEESSRWDNTLLLPEGDLLVVGRAPNEETYQARWDARYLLRLDWDGTELERIVAPVHHDVEVTPAGDYLALTYVRETIEKVHRKVPVNSHSLTRFARDGEELDFARLWDLLSSEDSPFRFQKVGAREHYGSMEVDLFHANSVEWLRDEALAASDPLYALGNVLVSIRHQDTLALFDWEQKRTVWAWGQREISGPHDATLLPNGNVLAFDNGLVRGWSRVIEVDPRTDEIVWEFGVPGDGARFEPNGPPSFFTATRGACQRLSNGNTLITNSVHGQVFEVTREGDVVWSWQARPIGDDRVPSVLVRARRLEGWTAADLEEPRAPFPTVD